MGGYPGRTACTAILLYSRWLAFLFNEAEAFAGEKPAEEAVTVVVAYACQTCNKENVRELRQCSYF